MDSKVTFDHILLLMILKQFTVHKKIPYAMKDWNNQTGHCDPHSVGYFFSV